MYEKEKMKQLFGLVVMMTGFWGLMCISGCGNDGCECVKPGISWNGETKGAGISLPGCGGILTSGKGCDNFLWSQSVKFITGCGDSDGCVLSCDDQYYGEESKGCLGCNAQADLKSCYSGIVIEDADNWGIFIGNTGSKERVLGCVGGESGCEVSDESIGESIREAEDALGIQ